MVETDQVFILVCRAGGERDMMEDMNQVRKKDNDLGVAPLRSQSHS